MSYRYVIDGYSGGYPLCEDPKFNDWFDEVRHTHTCCICQEEGHEDNFYQTNMGWMHVECYEAIVNDPDTTKEETPILI